MRQDARRGDVWMMDLGIAAKVRPCLLLTDYPPPNELALITIIPHTTSVRGNRWEIDLPVNFLKPGVFHLQQIQSVPISMLMRRLGGLADAEYNLILDILAERLSI
jgi:mRNA interferase MazF